jgi:hypothetical protein
MLCPAEILDRVEHRLGLTEHRSGDASFVVFRGLDPHHERRRDDETDKAQSTCELDEVCVLRPHALSIGEKLHKSLMTVHSKFGNRLLKGPLDHECMGCRGSVCPMSAIPPKADIADVG